MKDLLPFESSVRYLLESSIGQAKKVPCQKNTKTFLKIISSKIKQIVIQTFSYELRDDPLSLFVGASQFK